MNSRVTSPHRRAATSGLLCLLLIASAAAQSLVSSTADNGPGSLRQVIAEAPNATTLAFDPALSGATITLGSPILIDKTIIIRTADLPSGLTISGGGRSRIFTIAAGARLELYDVTLRDGQAPGGAPGMPGIDATIFTPATPGQPGGPGGNGGAILNDGQLLLEGCSFIANRAGNGGNGGRGGNSTSSIVSQPAIGAIGGAGGTGGAIFNNGLLSISRCTFSGNSGGNGGNGGNGGQNSSGARAAGGSGGGGGNGGAIAGSGSTNLEWTTLTLNSAGSGGLAGLGGGAPGGSGRGGALNGPVMTLRNSLIAGNTVPDLGDGRDAFGPVTSLGHNLVGASNGSTGWNPGNGDLLGSNAAPLNPLLGPLTTNLGKTPTHEPAPTSPAINAAQPGVEGLDQRGLPRPVGGRADIGAVEYQFPPILSVGAAGGGPVANGQTIDFGLLNPGDGISRTFVLYNFGANLLTNLSASLVGDHPEAFALTGPALTTLDNIQTTSVRIDFAGTTVGQKSATLRITSNDPANSPFDLHLTCEVNGPPSDIRLSNYSILENSPPGTVVGTLQAIDPNAGDDVTLAISEVWPPGNDAMFAIVGDALQFQAVANYEQRAGYEVTISATDSRGRVLFEKFPVRVQDVDEPPILSTIPNVTRELGAPPQPIVFIAYDQELPNRLTVHTPAAAAGEYAMSSTSFSPPFPAEGLAMEIIGADPILGASNPSLPLTNAAACAGKGVLFARGIYPFHHKFRNAENSGAIAAIIHQLETENLPGNLASTTGPSTLPGGMISHIDGKVLLAAALDGPVTATARPFAAGMNLEVTSDNPELLPQSGIAFSATSNNTATLLLTPADGRTGVANITVRATDRTGNENALQFRFEVVTPPLVGSTGPGVDPLATSSILEFGNLVIGETASRTVTIRNPETASIALGSLSVLGADSSFFTADASSLPPVLEPDAVATFILSYRPLTSGIHAATLRMLTPTGTNLLQFNLGGRAFSPSEDGDADGLNDAAELRLAALGFDWQVAQPELVATLMDSANLAGLFNTGQIQALNVGAPLLQRDPAGKVTLRLNVEKSTNLRDFLPLDFSSGQLIPHPAEGRIDLEFTPTDNAAFFRVEAD